MIYQDEISTSAEFNGSSWIMQENIFRANLKYLDDTRPWTLTLLITPLAPTHVAVQGKIHSITTSRQLTFELDPRRPVNIEIESTTGTRITPQFSPMPANNSRFALMAYLPNPEYSNAVLGAAVLGGFHLPDPARQSGTILGTAMLGATILAAAAPLRAWQNILGPGISIEFSRGIDHNGLTGRADPGTLNFTAYNALTPQASALVRGVQIVLIDADNRRPLFTGKISASRLIPDKDGTYTVSFTVLDAVNDLAQVTKYQDTRPAPVPWYVAVSGLITGYPARITTQTPAPLIGNLVSESSLVNYLDIFTTTAAATWYTAKDGTLTFTDTLETVPKILITDESTAAEIPAVSPVEIDAAYDTSEIITRVEATNNTAAKNSDGEWEAATAAVTVENPGNSAQYGEKTLTVETAAANHEALQSHLTALLASYEHGQIVKTAKFNLIDDTRLRPELEPILGLEILDPVQINFRRTSRLAHVARIRFTLTPRNLTAAIEFIQ